MNQKRLLFITGLLFCTAWFMSCHTDTTPRPDAWPRIYFPEKKSDIVFDDSDCPFMFHLPDYYSINRNVTFFNEKPDDPCWMNLQCKSLNATIYMSYKELNSGQTLEKLSEDAYRLTYKHSSMADYIEPQEIDNGHGVYGLIYYVGGDAASNFQFFVTDTVQNFVRGALYFYARPNADSLKPEISFMITDIRDMLNSWRWK